MLKLARGSSNFSVPGIEYDLPSRPKREARKRKGVHFNNELEVSNAELCTMSTSTFLRQKGMQWNSLAKAFDCDEDMGKDESVLLNELLNLCSFWAESEPSFREANNTSDEDEDSDEDGFEAFEQHIARLTSSSNPRFSTECSPSSSGVSSLRLGSLLRLNSQSYPSSTSSSETLSCFSKSPFSSITSPTPKECLSVKKRSTTAEELENAFRGIVEDDNDSSQETFSDSRTTADDFWSQVEF